ncbi:MAG: hypothetical protein JWM44_1008 [Bacilli bacterium]|jgi:hypothetical protein|nr:hypothetical protein [Bacilli bacterium]
MKKHWITVVGILFILSSIIYGLKMAGWITNELKIGAGLGVGLTLSMVYGFYALLLFLCGAYSRQTIYKGFGSIVHDLVAVKVFFLD